MKSIAEKLTEFRHLKGYTQEELADKAKVNLRTIQRIENAESDPRGKTLNLICEALDIETKNIISRKHAYKHHTIGTTIVNVFFLLVLNMILMGIIGFLTLDSHANINSLFGGVLLSFLIPFFIVTFTQKMNAIERLLKFGFGYFVYFILMMILHGFHIGFSSGLFPCLFISLVVLYFGNNLLKIIKVQKA